MFSSGEEVACTHLRVCYRYSGVGVDSTLSKFTLNGSVSQDYRYQFLLVVPKPSWDPVKCFALCSILSRYSIKSGLVNFQYLTYLYPWEMCSPLKRFYLIFSFRATRELQICSIKTPRCTYWLSGVMHTGERLKKTYLGEIETEFENILKCL